MLDFSARLLGLPIKFSGEIDLATFNIPLRGDDYISHGLSFQIGISNYRVGIAWEERSYNGGLSFEGSPTNFLLCDFSLSEKGVNFGVGAGVASGIKIEVENIDKLGSLQDSKR